jgi:hypothetical protein
MPARAAEAVVVTNATDVVNGRTSSISALNASPGSDGTSFREALIAANNTAGEKSITFATSLRGATIKVVLAALGLLPSITGGSISIDGDLDDDGTPDVILDGSGAGYGLNIRSSGNLITGLHLRNFETAVQFACENDACEPRTVTANRIVGNIIDGVIGIGPHGASHAIATGITWDDTEISRNTITSPRLEVPPIALRLGGGSAPIAISRTRILNNRLTGGYVGIDIGAGDGTSTEAGIPGPTRHSDGNAVRDTTISGNTIMSETPIALRNANHGNQRNRIDRTVISGNTLIGAYHVLAIVSAGFSPEARPTSLNVVAGVEVRGNSIRARGTGILVGAAGCPVNPVPAPHLNGPLSGNVVEDVVIADNDISYGDLGIQILGSCDSTENLVEGVQIIGNELRVAEAITRETIGIELAGGWTAVAVSRGNRLRDVTIRANTIRGDVGIEISGGQGPGATSNSVQDVVISGNVLVGNIEALRLIQDEDGATANTLSAVSSDAVTPGQAVTPTPIESPLPTPTATGGVTVASPPNTTAPGDDGSPPFAALGVGALLIAALMGLGLRWRRGRQP